MPEPAELNDIDDGEGQRRWLPAIGSAQDFARLRAQFDHSPELIDVLAGFVVTSIQISDVFERELLDWIRETSLPVICKDFRSGNPVFGCLVDMRERAAPREKPVTGDALWGAVCDASRHDLIEACEKGAEFVALQHAEADQDQWTNIRELLAWWQELSAIAIGIDMSGLVSFDDMHFLVMREADLIIIDGEQLAHVHAICINGDR